MQLVQSERGVIVMMMKNCLSLKVLSHFKVRQSRLGRCCNTMSCTVSFGAMDTPEKCADAYICSALHLPNTGMQKTKWQDY